MQSEELGSKQMDGYPSVLCLVMRGKPSFDFIKSVALLEGFDFYEQ